MATFIRPATQNDGEAIIALLRHIADMHHQGRPDIFRPDFSKYDLPQYLELLSREDVHILVSQDCGEVTGYAIAFCTEFKGDVGKYPSKHLYLDDLCVSPQERSKGTGRALMDAVEARAKELGCQKVELNVWNFKGNAIEFYKKCGYGATYTHMEKKI